MPKVIPIPRMARTKAEAAPPSIEKCTKVRAPSTSAIGSPQFGSGCAAMAVRTMKVVLTAKTKKTIPIQIAPHSIASINDFVASAGSGLMSMLRGKSSASK